METRSVYIGYDKREDIAYRVARFSLIRHSSIPLHVVGLHYEGLSHPGDGNGIHDRPYIQNGNQYVDCKDERPFSTEFAFTRFLIPCLEQYQPGWSLFVDCDFLFLADIKELFALADERYAVMCVKHEYRPKDGMKMDGVSQTPYFRKNWSSCMLWNTGHPANRKLTREMVNNERGRFLHGFGWLMPEEIGHFGEEWNWLEGHSKLDVNPKAVHFTAGGPWFPEYEDVMYADKWFAELARMQGHYDRNLGRGGVDGGSAI